MQAGHEALHAPDIWGEEETMANYLKPQDEVADNRERYRRVRPCLAILLYLLLTVCICQLQGTYLPSPARPLGSQRYSREDLHYT